MQTTTSIALGTDDTLIYDDVVVSVEWNSSYQALEYRVDGAYDYIGGKQIVAKFEPVVESLLEAKLNASQEQISKLKAEWEESPEARGRYAA